MSIQWLFIDVNSFFATVEQAERPWLRGKPVVVVPVMTDRTCCIAASYEAKRLGIRTGTNVGEARRICRHLQVVEARPAVYVDYHHQIVKAVDSVVEVDQVCSIDEMACRLGQGQRDPQSALKLGQQAKDAVRSQVNEVIGTSVGLAPNKFLAKIASNLQKPDGLSLLRFEDLPEKLLHLKLDDLTGIGPRMLRRLQLCGIRTIKQLYQQDEYQLQQAWNSVVGQQWWYLLRGYHFPEQPSSRKSLGHSHVLPPKLRTEQGARGVLLRLIHKGAARLRREKYWATRMSLHVSFIGHGNNWKVQSKFSACRDTSTLVGLFAELWERFPTVGIPLKVSVNFWKLVPNCSATASLFPEDHRRQHIAETMDAINQRFGVDSLYLAAMHDAKGTAPARIAFQHIPDVQAEGPTDFKKLHQWE